MLEEYKLLDKSTNYDVEIVRELAKAANELMLLENRAKFLTTLIKDNKELAKYVHTTREGKRIAIADLEDTHLQNIMSYFLRNDEEIPTTLAGEARKRNIVVPSNLTLESGESYDDSHDDYDFDMAHW